MAEALNGTVKTVLIHLLGPWRTCHQLEVGIIEWIDWYNTTRLHGEIGHIPPLEHEANWRTTHTPATMAITQQQ